MASRGRSARPVPVDGGAALAARDGRAALERSLTGRFWLRWHMALMLAAALACGLLVNRVLLAVPVHAALPRWLLALAAGYAVLFVAMRLWLAYVGVRPLGDDDASAGHRSQVSPGDLVDVPLGSSSGNSGGHGGGGSGFGGGGGRFGGAGATSDFAARAVPLTQPGSIPGVDAAPAAAKIPTLPAGSTSAHPSSGTGLGRLGDLGGVDDSVGPLIILALIAIAIVAVVGGGIVFLIATAPHLLVDVAFGAAVTGGVARGVRRGLGRSDVGWARGVFAATWKPVLAATVAVAGAAIAFQHWFPGARTLGEAWLSLGG